MLRCINVRRPMLACRLTRKCRMETPHLLRGTSACWYKRSGSYSALGERRLPCQLVRRPQVRCASQSEGAAAAVQPGLGARMLAGGRCPCGFCPSAWNIATCGFFAWLAADADWTVAMRATARRRGRRFRPRPRGAMRLSLAVRGAVASCTGSGQTRCACAALRHGRAQALCYSPRPKNFPCAAIASAQKPDTVPHLPCPTPTN
jgi:hypothetical protein